MLIRKRVRRSYSAALFIYCKTGISEQKGVKMQSTSKKEMLSLGLFVRIETKPGKEDGVAAFLMETSIAGQEPTTPLWFALRLGPTSFAVFDSFLDESGRQTHLNGPIAKALMELATTHLASPPSIEKTDVLGSKISRQMGNAD